MSDLTVTYRNYEILRLKLALEGDFDIPADNRAYGFFVHGKVRALAKLLKLRRGVGPSADKRDKHKLTKAEIAKARKRYCKAAGTVLLFANSDRKGKS